MSLPLTILSWRKTFRCWINDCRLLSSLLLVLYRCPLQYPMVEDEQLAQTATGEFRMPCLKLKREINNLPFLPSTAVHCGVHQPFGRGLVKCTTNLRKIDELISKSVSRLLRNNCQLHRMRRRRQTYPSWELPSDTFK